MLITKKITKLKDGSYDVQWNLPENEMSFLLTYAINNLVAEGLVAVEEINTTEDQLQLDLLGAIDFGESKAQ